MMRRDVDVPFSQTVAGRSSRFVDRNHFTSAWSSSSSPPILAASLTDTVERAGFPNSQISKSKK